MVDDDNDIEFYFLQLAQSVEPPNVQKWIAECARVLQKDGGCSLIPGKIGRSEPLLRRAGGKVIDEPLDDDKRSGATKRVLNLAEEYNVKGIIAHDIQILELATIVKSQQECELTLILQEVPAHLGMLQKRKLLKNLRQVDQIICASNYIARFIQSELNAPQDKVNVIYEGFDLHSISSQQVSQERTLSLAHAWGAVENMSELVLVPAVYNDPSWVENITDFARELARSEHRDILYIVIGDDDGSGAMNRLRNQLFKISPSNIQLAGHCADIEAAIKLTSTVLYFYSKTSSQFSDALIAQALGRFVFLPKACPASEEFIHENKTGKLLPTDATIIRETVEKFIADESNVREGNFVSTRSFIMQYFSREKMHRDLRAILLGA